MTPLCTFEPRKQSGVVLVLSMLLLVVITLLALSMFRSIGMQELIAGSLREKDRALQSAVSAQQYGEWWLTSGNNINNIFSCTGGVLNANIGDGHVCTNTLNSITGIAGITSFTTVPWTSTAGAEIGTVYTPPTMVGTGITSGAGLNVYWEPPRFYITLLGAAPSGEQGNIYQIDAWGYGGDPNTVAVVESTFLVSTGITCPGCM
ncbi:MAG: PilX N-terminal domain-containing pilus assembly protein [Steroidobacterales bacterium]